MDEVSTVLECYERDDNITAIIITGSEKAFAAGADIKEMKDNTFAGCIKGNFLNNWSKIGRCKKPTIAAVNGYAVSIIEICTLR